MKPNMIPTITPTTTYTIRDDKSDLDSKFLLSNPSPASPKLLHHEKQSPSPRPQWKKSADNNKNMSHTKQHKKNISQSPAPFLSFQVENERCAVYVGNIPLDERVPCKICFEDPCDDNDGATYVDLTKQERNSECCASAKELKEFLRDRINAAFKVPIEDIGIKTCRLFSVVTNVYSNIDSNTANDSCQNSGEVGSPKSVTTNTNANYRQRSGRRVHRAACVEFDDPKIAEYTLALKFTSFHFAGQPHNRSSLRMRRWTSQPPQTPPPPPQSKSMSPKAWSQKQRYTPPTPRSKSVSPKISTFKRQQQPPPPPPRPNAISPKSISPKSISPKSTSPMVFVRKQQQQPTINERASSPVSPQISEDLGSSTDDTSSNSGRESPQCSSCAVHVGNIPPDATSEELREFFLERMNKAFHGVTPPEIIRLGIRHCHDGANNTSSSTMNAHRIDACVEFQEPKVAFRATQLKNRRWYAKIPKECVNEIGYDPQKDDGADNKDSGSDNTNSINYEKKRLAMPLLEIEVWDSTKFDTSDFVFVNEDHTKTTENNFSQVEESEDVSNRSDMTEDPSPVSPIASPKVSPSQSQKAISTIEVARECGFLVCTNPNKTPKCDHLFTVKSQANQENNTLGEEKQARMCHGYAFRGKVCRYHKKTRGCNSKKRDVLCGPSCPFAHIDSFDQLTDPHDILSLLYYVENNDEVEFISGSGCTPQEYLLQQFEGKLQDVKGCFPSRDTKPDHSENSSTKSAEEIVKQLRSDLSAVTQELATTQEQLQKSELERQYLLEQQTYHASLNSGESPVKSNMSTELLELEVIKLREELQQSRAECQKLKRLQQPSGSPPSNAHTEDSWPEFVQLDNFLEKSIPTLMQMTDGSTDSFLEKSISTLMQMTDGSTDEQYSPPKSSLIDGSKLNPSSPRHIPYNRVADCNSMQSLGLSTTTINEATTAATDEDSLQQELSYLLSFYGNQVSVMNGLSTVVTRFLKLPMTQYKGRDIDVALVLTIPKGYPWNGIVKVNSDPRFTNHFGADSHYVKIVSESISGLLNVCRWEAEACQGKQHVLINIMKLAERWVENDWKIIQTKNLIIDQDPKDGSQSSSLLSL